MCLSSSYFKCGTITLSCYSTYIPFPEFAIVAPSSGSSISAGRNKSKTRRYITVAISAIRYTFRMGTIDTTRQLFRRNDMGVEEKWGYGCIQTGNDTPELVTRLLPVLGAHFCRVWENYDCVYRRETSNFKHKNYTHSQYILL